MAITLYGNGQVMIQQAYAETTVKSSTASTIPSDNTIPQITEGAQCLSVSITPKLSTSYLNIYVSVATSNTANSTQTIAVFRDSNADAVGSFSAYSYGRGGSLAFHFRVSANNTNATTFTVRYGAISGSSWINQTETSTLPAGVVSSIIVQEIAG